MMDWKIQRDPYLSLLCQKHGESAALEAGFFRDEDPENAPLDDLDWLSTPRPKRAVQGARPVVLLATGGFFPVHAGHLEMMESARGVLEREGFEVIGGYLSPGHDSYIRLKCGDQLGPAPERLRQAAEAIAGSDWLAIDPWEAMHRRVAVNYTDVTARLEAYLQQHVDPRIEVAYVCGGDNARFAYAFTERGRAVVVSRPGSDHEVQKWRERLGSHPRIHWAQGGNPSASRALRSGPPAPAGRPRLVVRLEDARAVRTLGLRGFDTFQEKLVALLAQHAEVRTAPLREQPGEENVISLDAMLPARHSLAVSRLFAPGGYEALGHVARPLAPPLEEQIARIPPGTYTLRDDDSVSGETLRRVSALLPPTVTISRTEVAIEHAPGEDVIDARDFLLGADEGGLVLALPGGGIGRAPYVLPYVDPAARASIPHSHAFSVAVWELNAQTFATTDLKVRNLPAPARATLPFPDDLRLDQLCAWHAARIRQISAL